MYEPWQVIPAGHCLFDSTPPLPPTAPAIRIYISFALHGKVKDHTSTNGDGGQKNSTEAANTSTKFITLSIRVTCKNKTEKIICSRDTHPRKKLKFFSADVRIVS